MCRRCEIIIYLPIVTLCMCISTMYINSIRRSKTKGVGYGQVFSTAVVTTYYLSIMGMTVRYFVDSFKSPLPWSLCRKEWGSCTAPVNRMANITSLIAPKNGSRSSAELYYM